MRRRSVLTRGRRTTIAVGLALISALAIGVGTALADAGNPINGTINVASAKDNGDGTITVSVRGQWNWQSHGSDCNFDRAATGAAMAWGDLNGPGTTRGINEVQTFTITGNPTGGTYKLKFNGTSTAAIDTPCDRRDGSGRVAGHLDDQRAVRERHRWPHVVHGRLRRQPRQVRRQPQMQLGNKSFTGGTNPNITFATTTNGSFPVFNGYLLANGTTRLSSGRAMRRRRRRAGPTRRTGWSTRSTSGTRLCRRTSRVRPRRPTTTRRRTTRTRSPAGRAAADASR